MYFLKGRERERQSLWGEGVEISSIRWSILQMVTQLGLDQAKAWSQQLRTDITREWQEAECLGHHLLLSRHISRKLAQQHSRSRLGAPVWNVGVCCATAPLLLESLLNLRGRKRRRGRAPICCFTPQMLSAAGAWQKPALGTQPGSPSWSQELNCLSHHLCLPGSALAGNGVQFSGMGCSCLHC